MRYVIRYLGGGKWGWSYEDHKGAVKECSGVEHGSKEACLAMVKELRSYSVIRDAEYNIL